MSSLFRQILAPIKKPLLLSAALVLVMVVALAIEREPLDPSLPKPPTGLAWQKVFEDSFTEKSLNSSKWVTCYDWALRSEDGCTNDGNSEQEWYLPDNVRVEDGSVSLSAKKQLTKGSSAGLPKDFDYTSGMITTGRSSSSSTPKWFGTFGYYEAKIKIPAGRGLWPAFWLVPADKSWPPEIDIMESLGDQPNKVLQTYFWNDGHYPPPLDTSSYIGPDYSTGWHTFGLYWQPERLDWYIDGVITKTVINKNVPAKAMEIILNLAVGGNLPGGPDDNTLFPAQMYVDFVNVYQLKLR